MGTHVSGGWQLSGRAFVRYMPGCLACLFACVSACVPAYSLKCSWVVAGPAVGLPVVRARRASTYVQLYGWSYTSLPRVTSSYLHGTPVNQSLGRSVGRSRLTSSTLWVHIFGRCSHPIHNCIKTRIDNRCS